MATANAIGPPSATAILTRTERNHLVAEIELDISAIEDVKKTIARAGDNNKDTRRRFADACWLLDDLGASIDPQQERYAVTMPAARFEAYLKRVRTGLADTFTNRVVDDTFHAQVAFITVCDAILERIRREDSMTDRHLTAVADSPPQPTSPSSDGHPLELRVARRVRRR